MVEQWSSKSYIRVRFLLPLIINKDIKKITKTPQVKKPIKFFKKFRRNTRYVIVTQNTKTNIFLLKKYNNKLQNKTRLIKVRDLFYKFYQIHSKIQLLNVIFFNINNFTFISNTLYTSFVISFFKTYNSFKKNHQILRLHSNNLKIFKTIYINNFLL